MANTTNKSKTTNKKSTTKPQATKTKQTENNDSKSKIKKQRDMNELIRVINITNSRLTYISKSQNGYRIDWDQFGEENWIEYKELLNMRGSQRKFFEEPWIMCDFDVLEDLKVDKYYKNIIDLDNLDTVFNKSAKELEKTLKIVPNGIKKLIVDRAIELIKNKALDRISVIETIEKTLNIELMA